MDFLTENGLLIFEQIKSQCKDKLKLFDLDDLEMGMLANSFDIYATNARYCRDNGQTFEMKTKTGIYPMVRPEYNIMKNEYAQILKHSGKFGLNPSDRDKLFKKAMEPEEPVGKDRFKSDKMKIA